MGELDIKWSPYVMGIDLGTSTSSVAIYYKGAPVIIDIEGKKLIPSVVHVRDNGDVLVGNQAKSKILLDPENTVASVKREMGNTSYKKKFKGNPDKEYTPADISAEILSKLKEGAQFTDKITDLKGTLRYAVICVPANFDDNKKQETLKAGELAGLEVISLLAEPEAASIGYAYDKGKEQTILVYDLGGGTFDVSILKVEGDNFKVLSTEGIPELGGDDFDKKIVELASVEFKSKANLDLLDTKKEQGISKKKLMEAQQKLKEAAEQAKKELSETVESEISIPNIIKDEQGNLHNLEFKITREQFETAIKDLVASSEEAVKKALENAKLTKDDIDRIILVGGSTKVPLVKKVLTDMFGREPYTDPDPDTAVARGASIFGADRYTPGETDGIIDPIDKPKDIGLETIVTHYLGIEIKGRKFDKIIEKGITLNEEHPVETQTKEYSTQQDEQEEMRIGVYQSPDVITYIDDPGAVCLGEFYLTGIPKATKGKEKVEVTFEINKENLLKVTATSKSASGSTTSLEIKRD